jgi:hypothetical protein
MAQNAEEIVEQLVRVRRGSVAEICGGLARAGAGPLRHARR